MENECHAGDDQIKFIVPPIVVSHLSALQTVASWAVVVDAKEGAHDLYLKHEFISMQASPGSAVSADEDD